MNNINTANYNQLYNLIKLYKLNSYLNKKLSRNKCLLKVKNLNDFIIWIKTI